MSENGGSFSSSTSDGSGRGGFGRLGSYLIKPSFCNSTTRISVENNVQWIPLINYIQTAKVTMNATEYCPLILSLPSFPIIILFFILFLNSTAIIR